MAAFFWTLLLACLTQRSHGQQPLHAGADCFTACSRKPGFCDYCGIGMACCQRNLVTDPQECQGSLQWKAVGVHECIKPLYGPGETPPKSAIPDMTAAATAVSDGDTSYSGAVPQIAGILGPVPTPTPAPQQYESDESDDYDEEDDHEYGSPSPSPALAAAVAREIGQSQQSDYSSDNFHSDNWEGAAEKEDEQMNSQGNYGGAAAGVGGLAGALAGMAGALGGVSTTAPLFGGAAPPLPGAAASTFSGSAPDLSATGFGGGSTPGSIAAGSSPVPGVPNQAMPNTFSARQTASTKKTSSSAHSSSSTSSGGHGWIFLIFLLLLCCCAAGGGFFWFQKKNKKVKPRGPEQFSSYDYEGQRPPMYQEVPMDPVMRPGSVESMSNVGPGMQEPRAFQTNLMPTDSIPSQTPWSALQNMAPGPVQPAVMPEVQAQPVTAPTLASQPPVAYPGLPQAGSQYTTVNTTLGQTVSLPSSASQYTTPQTIYQGATAQYTTPTTVFPGGSAQAPSTQLTGAPPYSTQFTGATPYSAAQAPIVSSVTTTTQPAAPVMTSMQVQGQGYTQPMTVFPATQPMMQSMQVSGGAATAYTNVKPARYVS